MRTTEETAITSFTYDEIRETLKLDWFTKGIFTRSYTIYMGGGGQVCAPLPPPYKRQ